MVACESIHTVRRALAVRHLSSRRQALALLGLFFSSALIGPGRGYAQCEYEITIIQPPECPILGIPVATPRGISNVGHIAGHYPDCLLQDVFSIAFFWTPELGVVEIPFPDGTLAPGATDINSDGRIVGGADFPADGLGHLAFVFEDGKLTNLGTIPGGNSSSALAVNECGQVVGFALDFVDGDPPRTPFLWENGVMTPLEVTFGPKGEANDINDNGQIVGWMGNARHNNSHAYIWKNGDVTDLGTPPGAFAAEATAINNVGQVLVQGRFQKDKTSPFLVHSFLWDDGQWTDFGLLPGFDRCYGLDLNDAGQAMGYCTKSAMPNDLEAFIWQEGVLTRLDDLVVAPPEVNVAPLGAINQLGQIAVQGELELFEAAVLLLTPIDQPPGDLNHDCAVGINDFLILLAAWGPCPPSGACPGDLDGDRLVGIVDLLILLASWS